MNLLFSREVGHCRYFTRRILWRLTPPETVQLPTGAEFPLPRTSTFASDVYVTECNVDWNSEYILLAYLSSEKNKGDLLDVGAHIGYYSCLLSPYVERIWSFEPDKRNHENLKKAIGLLDKAQIISKAVSDTDGEIGFNNSCGSAVGHITAVESKTGTTVPAVTLDAFVAEKSAAPSVIKMDIEGYEISALKGAKNVLGEFSPIVLVEYNQEAGKPNTWEGLQDLANEVGYSIFAVTRKPEGSFSYAYTFAEYHTSELRNLSSKMIFLVPQAKKTWFSNLSQTDGS